MVKDKKVAVITGSSSGIGFETTLAFARNGYLTYATMRNMQKSKELERITNEENIQLKKIVGMDVNSDVSVKDAVNEIISEAGQIDVLVNNAGYGLFGALEDMTMEEIKKQFETNIFGIIRVTKNVLPIMRQQQSGIIVNISSISGLVGFPSQSIYCSTKFAVEGLSESLSYEMEPYGIKMVLVEPGVIKTEFVQDLIVPANRYGIDKSGTQVDISEHKDKRTLLLSPYNNTIEKYLSFYYNAMSNAPNPQVVASKIMETIKKISDKKNSDLIIRVTIGSDSKKYSEQKRELTDNEFHEMLREILLK